MCDPFPGGARPKISWRIGMQTGSDDGTTYKAPDKDTSPKKKTMKAATRHFVMNGTTPPVGTLTFTLQR